MDGEQKFLLGVFIVFVFGMLGAGLVSGYIPDDEPGRPQQPTKEPAAAWTPSATTAPAPYPAPATATATTAPYPAPPDKPKKTATTDISATLTAWPTDFVTATAPLPTCHEDTAVPCFTKTPETYP